MPRRNEFVEHLVELLAPLGDVRARAMFGGWGLYADGRMFGLVADDAFYLKVDNANREEFARAGLGPFVYRGKSGPVAMSYYEAPPDAMDDADALCAWAEKAIAAAARQAKKQPKKKRC